MEVFTNDTIRLFGGISGIDSWVLDNDVGFAAVRLFIFSIYIASLFLLKTKFSSYEVTQTLKLLFIASWMFSVFKVSKQLFVFAITTLVSITLKILI